MKKKVLAIALCASTLLSFTACGKSEEEKQNEALKAEIESMKEELGLNGDSSFVDMLIEEELAMQAEKEVQAETQGEYKVYDRLPEWDTIEEPFAAIQIDDTIYEFGTTIGKIMQQIENSEISYEIGLNYEGNPSYTKDMLVDTTPVVGGRTIDIYRDGAKWFCIYYSNQTESILSINDCICHSIECYEPALKHTYILGMSQEEWLSIKYNEIDTKMQSIDALNNCTVTSDQTTWTYSKDIIKESNEQKHLITTELIISTDMTTGKIGEYHFQNGWAEEYYEYTPLLSFQNLPETAWDKLLVKMNNFIQQKDELNKYSLTMTEAILAKEYSASETFKLFIYCKLTAADGSVIYKCFTIPPLLANEKYILYDQNDIFISLSCYRTEYSSLDEAKQDIEHSGRVLYEVTDRITF